jgi:hypothetical protein
MDRIHLKVIPSKLIGQRLHAVVGDPCDHESICPWLVSDPPGDLSANAVSSAHNNRCASCHWCVLD